MKIYTCLASALLLAIGSCTHKKVDVHRMNDHEMSCGEIVLEMTETKELLKDIDSKTGMSGRNVGMGLLFWPGVVVNQMNASDATKLATDRMNVLVSLYKNKGCQNRK
jgi:hypothetical protein